MKTACTELLSCTDHVRSACGQSELDELLAERDKINLQIQEILDSHTEPWGVKVSMVEVKRIDLPQEMQRAIARQAEAEKNVEPKSLTQKVNFRPLHV